MDAFLLNSASAFYDLVKYKNKWFEKSIFLCLFFEGEFKLLQYNIKKIFSKSVVESLYSFPSLSMPQLVYLRVCPAILSCLSPSGVLFQQFTLMPLGQEKMVLCQPAAERQFVTKCKGRPQAARQANFLNARWLIFFMWEVFLFRAGPKGSQHLSWGKESIRNKSTLLSYRFLSCSSRTAGNTLFKLPLLLLVLSGKRQKWQLQLLLWTHFQTVRVGEMKGRRGTRGSFGAAFCWC